MEDQSNMGDGGRCDLLKYDHLCNYTISKLRPIIKLLRPMCAPWLYNSSQISVLIGFGDASAVSLKMQRKYE